MSLSSWRPRLSLRAMLAVITIVAITLGSILYRARRQADALRELAPQIVVWNYQIPPDGDLSKWDPSAQPGPSWLQVEGVPALFSRVRGVILVKPKAKEAIERLRSLPDLVILNLSGSDVDDAALDEVAQLDELKSLNLDWTPVTDAGLAKLVALHDLEALWLNETDVTSAGLESLAKLPKLQRLYVEGTAVDEAAVKKLRQSLPECEIWWGPPSSPQDQPFESSR